ncbi:MULTISPECIES: hypothetical protein [Cupriavidus]|uniref:hypothetical protein n=1 Tax=Cupriavidus TaxID=106589 RepID=UPI00295EB256|nr:hypothetical protein [Cupriavidus sp. TKC]
METKDIEFVSLAEVLVGIEVHISIPEAIAGLPGCDAEWIVHGRDISYRASEAASKLYQALCLASEGARPRWLATGSGAIQRPLPTEAAKTDGMTVLQERVDWYGGWLERHMRFNPSLFRRDRWSGPTIKPHFADSFDEIRPHSGYGGERYAISELGFELAEIVAFLDRHDITHSFQVAKEGGGIVQEDSQPGLPTPDMAAAFAGLSEWGIKQWTKCLNEVKWPGSARITKGRPGQGREGADRWDPIILADLARKHRKISLSSLRRKFRETAQLQPWLAGWKEYEDREIWYGSENPPDNP